MAETEYMYVIGLGHPGDWAQGQGAFYYIESIEGEVVLPLFSSAEKAQKYIKNNFYSPQAHMELLESGGYSGAANVTAGRYMTMPYKWPGKVAEVAVDVGADILIKDPREGAMQEMIYVSKE